MLFSIKKLYNKKLKIWTLSPSLTMENSCKSDNILVYMTTGWKIIIMVEGTIKLFKYWIHHCRPSSLESGYSPFLGLPLAVETWKNREENFWCYFPNAVRNFDSSLILLFIMWIQFLQELYVIINLPFLYMAWFYRSHYFRCKSLLLQMCYCLS